MTETPLLEEDRDERCFDLEARSTTARDIHQTGRGGGGGSRAKLQQTHARRMRTWETVKSDRDERHNELLFQWGPGNDGGSAVANRANWGSEASNA